MRRNWLALLLASAAVLSGCRDQDSPSAPKPDPAPPPLPLGVYDFYITGIGSPSMSATVARVDPDSEGLPSTGANYALNSVGSGLFFESATASGFFLGARGSGRGQRYITLTFRVRNSTGAPVNNVTFIPIITNTTIPGTPFLSVRRFDAAPADPALALEMIPTGYVMMGDGMEMISPVQDVLQVFTEGEVGAISLPPGTQGIFPYGFVVRNLRTPNNRLLEHTADETQYDGMMTFALRIPMPPNDPGTSNGETKDVYSFGIRTLAVQDTETRLTESIEESQDTAAVRRLRAKATAMGATTVTVLAGSPAASPGTPNYPGQRQLCTVRTAGQSGSPITTITNHGPFTNVMILRPGESMHPCEPYFRTGTPARPATNVPFELTLKAVDRYGNLRIPTADSVRLGALSGPSVTLPTAPVELVSASATTWVTYHDYGNAVLEARALRRRQLGVLPLQVAGVTRTWTGNVSTEWGDGANWNPTAVPMQLDSVLVPAGRPAYPVLASNVSIAGVTVENGGSISLGAFDLTASANVFTGTSGQINATVGRLFLTGTGRTLGGNVPRLRVSGTYSLISNVTARAPVQVDAGRITSGSFRLQSTSF